VGAADFQAVQLARSRIRSRDYAARGAGRWLRSGVAGRTDEHERGSEGGRTQHSEFRAALAAAGLVLVEFALALVLLAGVGLLLHSFWDFRRADLGTGWFVWDG
jgi:hypothetical protein